MLCEKFNVHLELVELQKIVCIQKLDALSGGLG
jgi:hypothetical protein